MVQSIERNIVFPIHLSVAAIEKGDFVSATVS